MRLIGENLALSAGSEYEVACQSTGSRPPAAISWWKAGQMLEQTREKVSIHSRWCILHCWSGHCWIRHGWFKKMKNIRVGFKLKEPNSVEPASTQKQCNEFVIEWKLVKFRSGMVYAFNWLLVGCVKRYERWYQILLRWLPPPRNYSARSKFKN